MVDAQHVKKKKEETPERKGKKDRKEEKEVSEYIKRNKKERVERPQPLGGYWRPLGGAKPPVLVEMQLSP